MNVEHELCIGEKKVREREREKAIQNFDNYKFNFRIIPFIHVK